MASLAKSECFRNAVISASDMRITEIFDDYTQSYDIWDILERWDGIKNVTLTISSRERLHSDMKDEY